MADPIQLPEVARPFQQFLEPSAAIQGAQAVQQIGQPAGNMGKVGNIAYYLDSFIRAASAGKAVQSARNEMKQYQDYNQLSKLLQLTQNPSYDPDAASQVQAQIVKEMGSHAVEEAKRQGKNNPVMEMFGKLGEGLLGGPGTKYEKLTPDRLNQITQQVMSIPKKTDIAQNLYQNFFNGAPGPEGKKLPGVGDLVAQYQKDNDGVLPTKPELDAMVMQNPHLMSMRAQSISKFGEDPMAVYAGPTYQQQQNQVFDSQEKKYSGQEGKPFDAIPPAFLEKAISIKRPGYKMLSDRFVNGEPALIYETPFGFRDELGYVVKPDNIKTLSQVRDAAKSKNIGWAQLTSAEGLKDPKLKELFATNEAAFKKLQFKMLERSDGTLEPAMVGGSYIINDKINRDDEREINRLGIQTERYNEQRSDAILARREAADNSVARWYEEQTKQIDTMAAATNLDGTPKYGRDQITRLRKNVSDTVGAVRYNTAHASEVQQNNLDKTIEAMRLYGDPQGLQDHLAEIRKNAQASMKEEAPVATPAATPAPPEGQPAAKVDLLKLNNPMGLTKPGSKPGDPDRFDIGAKTPEEGWNKGLNNLKALMASLPPNAKLVDLMQKYAPKEEAKNNPVAYASSIAQKLKLPQGGNTPISALKGREQEIASVIGGVEVGDANIKPPWSTATTAAATPQAPSGKALSLDQVISLAP